MRRTAEGRAGGTAGGGRPGGDRATGIVLAAAGSALALEATTFDVAFMTDPVGPKAVPLLVAAMIFSAGVLAILRPREAADPPPGPTALRMAGAVAAFLVYAAALPWLGFFVSTTLVVLALGLLYRGPPASATVAAALLSGALWLLFVEVLALPLPVGDLWIR